NETGGVAQVGERKKATPRGAAFQADPLRMSLHASAFRLGEDVRCGREERLRSGRLESQLEQSAAVPGSTEDLDDLRTPVGAHHDVARLQLDIRTAHPAGVQIHVYAQL